MLNLYGSPNGKRVSKKDGKWSIEFPEPTMVGEKQSIVYTLRNDAKLDRYEIKDVTVEDSDLSVLIDGECYLFPKDQVTLTFTYSPSKDRKNPLEKVLFVVNANHIIVAKR